jgi:hypothetical protein
MKQCICVRMLKKYLYTLLDRPEYMRLALNIITQGIIDKYKLSYKAKNGYVHIRIDKGMYGLPQAGRLVNNLLVKRLASHGYHPVERTHGLWCHKTRPITFTLVVGVKYVDREHADQLLHPPTQHYEVTYDWEGKLYCGILLKWDYEDRTVDLPIPGYIENALHKFQHKPPD